MSRIVLGDGEGLRFQKYFLQTSFVHVPMSRQRRNLYLLDLRDNRSVRSTLLLKNEKLKNQPQIFTIAEIPEMKFDFFELDYKKLMKN